MENVIFDMCQAPLGDELSMFRNGLLDLFFQKKITENVVIYCLKDRSLLYRNIFSNITNAEDSSLEAAKEFYEKETGKKYECISINSIIMMPTIFWEKYGGHHRSLDKNCIIHIRTFSNMRKKIIIIQKIILTNLNN